MVVFDLKLITLVEIWLICIAWGLMHFPVMMHYHVMDGSVQCYAHELTATRIPQTSICIYVRLILMEEGTG